MSRAPRRPTDRGAAGSSVALTRLGLQQTARFLGQLADGHRSLAIRVVVLELDQPVVLFQLGQLRSGRGIANLDDRFDGGSDHFFILVIQEAVQQLGNARLGKLDQDVRQLGESQVVGGQFAQRAFDPQGHFLEPVEGQVFEHHPGGVARFGLFAAQNVDQRIDRLRAGDAAQNLRNRRELQRALFFIGELARRMGGIDQGFDHLLAVARSDLLAELAGSALRLEELGQSGRDGGTVGESHDHGGIVFSAEMHPLIRAALVCAVVAALGSRAPAPGGPDRVLAAVSRHPGSNAVHDRGSERSGITSGLCAPRSLPDGDMCVPIPDPDDGEGEELVAEPGAHHDKRGRYEMYEQIPRRPERPAGYAAYRYPVPLTTPNLTMSGYDLDQPETAQRQGRRFSHVGHGGIDLAAPKGAEVHLVALEHQEGAASVVYVGKLFGTSVVTRHTVREAGKLREYIVLYGHLDAPAAGLAQQRELAEGALVGYVGDSGSPGIVHLHLEVRRVRDGVDVAKLAPERLVANENTVVCDPRNVLPLR